MFKMSKSKFKFKNGDVLELKAIKVCEWASEETHCFESKLYLNGKLLAFVSNDGHGACNRLDVNYPLFKGSEFRVVTDKLREELPKYYMEFDNSWSQSDLEVWVGEAVTDHLIKKDFNRLIKSKVLYVNPKSENPKAIYQFSWKGVRKVTQRHIDSILGRKEYADYIVLNALPLEQAYRIFEEGA